MVVTSLPDRLESPRVRLILISRQDAADMLAGRRQDRWHPAYPRRDDLDAVSMVGAGQSETDHTWGPRHVVVDALAVGSIGCFGPPMPATDGTPETEVGYGLVADYRGIGIATEALGLLCGAVDELGVRLRASTEPDNAASLRVLAKAGFTQVRGTDEEGHLVLVRPVASA